MPSPPCSTSITRAKQGEWIPNKFGGRENLEAIDFLRRFNQEVYKEHPEVQTIAEESTSWPMVSRPTYVGGLGFGLKWDMGWMHDTLEVFPERSHPPQVSPQPADVPHAVCLHENFVLPLSHDEVVHGKGSLIGKMPGDEWQKFANLRLLFGYMYAQPGKKLLFMGGEFGQVREWEHDSSLDWHVLQYPVHRGVQAWMEQLNRFYRSEPAMHVLDNDPAGFEWIDCQRQRHQHDLPAAQKRESPQDTVLVVCNFTPVPRIGYRVGVPHGGYWREMLNSDAANTPAAASATWAECKPTKAPARPPFSLKLTLPPLAALFFKAV